MNFEHQRLRSFNKCTISLELKSKLALYGLYYKKDNYIVQCFSCKVSFCCKNVTNVLDEHLKHSPNCRFLLKLDKTNNPINEKLLQLPNKLFDECGILPAFNPNDYECRLNTFKNWTGLVPGNKLAEAGFWFTKTQDIVHCSFCKVEINKWRKEDDPWIEHILYSKNCDFVKSYLQTRDGRIHSFKTMKGDPNINLLASAGFYYTGYKYDIESICCNILLTNWKPQQAIMEIHKKLKPKCLGVSFFNKFPTNLLQTFDKIAISKEKKDEFVKENIYYNSEQHTLVCSKCYFSMKFSEDKFVHDEECLVIKGLKSKF